MGDNMKKDRRMIILILLLVILTVDFIITLYDKIDYEKRKESGNERWRQVETIINDIDERVKELEENARNN